MRIGNREPEIAKKSIMKKKITICLFLTFLLGSFGSAASGTPAFEVCFTCDLDRNEVGAGIVKVKSDNSFSETAAKLEAAIEANSALKVIAKIDHSANAKTVGRDLRPTLLFIIGNPRMGTPLMLAEQTSALDLPQKMLVFEDEKGNVYIAYNDPEFIAQRHGIANDHPAVKTAATGLANLAKAASTK